MRFITEFKLSEDDDSVPLDEEIKYNTDMQHVELGAMIGESFGWQNNVDRNHLHYRLEIEAFPMDKWLKFKAGIIECIEQSKANNYPPMFALLSIGNLLKELESFGAKKEPL